MKKWLNAIIYNYIGSVTLVSYVILMIVHFRIGDFVQWVVLNTSIFFTYIVILSIILTLLTKYEIAVIEKIKRKSILSYRILTYVFALLLFVLIAIWLNFMLQYHLQLKDIAPTVNWIVEKQKLFGLGALYLFLIGLLYFAVTGRMFVSLVLLFGTTWVFAVVNFNKVAFLGEPLYPSDFRQLGNVMDITNMVTSYLSPSVLVLLFVLMFLVIGLFWYMKDVKIGVISRLGLVLVSSFFLYSFTFYPSTFMKSIVENDELNIARFNQVFNYQRNGFLLGFIYNLNHDAMEKPPEYSEKLLGEIVDKILNGYEQSVSEPTEVEKPHIIYLMNETFWDPTKLDVTFSEEPMPHIRNYMESYPSGNLLSPSFGGSTANVEYEAITGFSMSTLKSGALPYQQIIDRKPFVPSIVSVLNEMDYESIALHSHTKAYFKRTTVYKTFGFHEFISMDEMKHAEKSGRFISDESVTNEIIHLLNERDKRLFIHAVTMQNHFPYRENRYKENTVEVTGLTGTYKQELEVFTEGIKQADAATKKLLDYLDEYPEPVMVVFWGDHLPILGEDKGLYREVNYANINTVGEDYRAFHETPLFVYANFELPDMDLKTVSTTFLGPIAFELAGLAEPPFYWFLNQIRKEVPGLSRNVKVGADGRTINDLTEEQEELLKMYEMIQYDLLLGRQYSKDILYHVD